MLTKKDLFRQFQKEWKKHYALKVFEERGFVRKQCRACRKFFWTLNKKRGKCGDSCCEPYSFIRKRVVKQAYDYTDTWTEFANFFKSKGRTIIPRYPTIARWRDDTWFVQASIYDFQPHVVSGEVRPPANPLVVPQPCFRFNDIENIGVTSRHYSGFVMIGQHNFVSSAGHVAHWKDEDIGLAIDVLKNFGINEREITLAENVWMGGGNAGPCFELFVRGLEVLTTVFMQYAITDEGLKELPLKIIDFGWGLERLAWLLNGTTTSYEVVFDPVDKKFMKKFGIKLNETIVRKFASEAAYLNVEDVSDVQEELKRIAKRIHVPAPKLLETVNTMRAFYSILDHTRTLMFALADGALPSNSGGGYNLRFILRRALRLAEKHGWPVDLAEIAEDLARAYAGARPRRVENVRGEELMEVGARPMFPDLLEAMPQISKILKLETQKYHETKQRASQILAGLLKTKKKVTEEDLVILYDSQGIMPEDVVQAAEPLKIKVVIPQDFYSKVASLHTERKKDAAKTNAALIGALKGLPKTYPLYYDDEKTKEFSARVLKIINNAYVVLDKTAFYPTGGGQLNDLGTLNGATVVDVQKVGNVVLHVVEDLDFREGDTVIGKLDWERRAALIRNHDATHIVNGVARAVLGEHIWQAGSEVAPDKARLDITHYAQLTAEEIKKIENLANQIVFAGLPIKKITLPKNEAEKRYGFRLYQGGYVPGADIRVVLVENEDVEACGGTHGSNTANVGLIKVLGAKKIQDGIVRLEFVAGPRALEEVQRGEEMLKNASQIFSIPVDQLPKTCERFFKEWKEQRKEIERLKSQGKPQAQQNLEQKTKEKKQGKGNR